MSIEPKEDLLVYSPPRAEAAVDPDAFPDPDEPGLIGAEFWPRAAARVIDWVFMVVVASVGGVVGAFVLMYLGPAPELGGHLG